MRHPWPYLLGVTGVLLVLAVPFLHIQLGQIDDRVVPPDVASSRAAVDQIRANFSSRENAALRLYLPGVDPTTDVAAIDEFAKKLRDLPGVARVDAASGFYFKDGTTVPPVPSLRLTTRFFSDKAPHSTWVNVVPDIEPISQAGEDLVAAVRATNGPGRVHGGGPVGAARRRQADDRGPHPARARLHRARHLLVAVPDDRQRARADQGAGAQRAQPHRDVRRDGVGVPGRSLHRPARLHADGAIDIFTPLLMFCIAFGLSMDYEVFLLSRIKEEYDYDHDNERAVAVGLGKTGPIVTAAALVLTIVFLGLTTSEVVQVKLFGLGLALAVLVDAFLIRATLVPAFMRLAGRVNWWAPRWCAAGTSATGSGSRSRSRSSTARSRRADAQPNPTATGVCSGAELRCDFVGEALELRGELVDAEARAPGEEAQREVPDARVDELRDVVAHFVDGADEARTTVVRGGCWRRVREIIGNLARGLVGVGDARRAALVEQLRLRAGVRPRERTRIPMVRSQFPLDDGPPARVVGGSREQRVPPVAEPRRARERGGVVAADPYRNRAGIDAWARVDVVVASVRARMADRVVGPPRLAQDRQVLVGDRAAL